MVTIVVTMFTAAYHIQKIRVPHPLFSPKKTCPERPTTLFSFSVSDRQLCGWCRRKKDVTIPTPFLSYPNQTFPELNIPTELNHQAECSGHSAWYQRRHTSHLCSFEPSGFQTFHSPLPSPNCHPSFLSKISPVTFPPLLSHPICRPNLQLY